LYFVDGLFQYEMLIAGLHGGDFLHTKTLLGWGMQAKSLRCTKAKRFPWEAFCFCSLF
jgi:hypothetical protein